MELLTHSINRLASSARPSHEGPYIHQGLNEGTQKDDGVLEVYYPNICRYIHSLGPEIDTIS
jgi:hypothetical protein